MFQLGDAKNAGLNALLFYSIDKASPYALAQHEATNSLEKVAEFSLVQLAITEQGKAVMWLWINAHSTPFGAKPVSPSVAGKAESVVDVVQAVYATIPAGGSK
ncbi:MAG: hypothetical protein U1F05_13650 [Burkholderiales bacterium]